MASSNTTAAPGCAPSALGARDERVGCGLSRQVCSVRVDAIDSGLEQIADPHRLEHERRVGAGRDHGAGEAGRPRPAHVVDRVRERLDPVARDQVLDEVVLGAPDAMTVSSDGPASGVPSGRVILPRGQERTDAVETWQPVDVARVVRIDVERPVRLALARTATGEEPVEGLLPRARVDGRSSGQDTVEVEQQRRDLIGKAKARAHVRALPRQRRACTRLQPSGGPDLGPNRGVIAQPLRAPVVQVVAGERPEVGRGQDVVQAIPERPRGVSPGAVAAPVTVKRAERIGPAGGRQPRDEPRARRGRDARRGRAGADRPGPSRR